jgi:uncharacterized protein YqjF (DUF2071 family)
MRQTWRDLLFLHTPVEPALIQATLPARLTVDTYPDDNGREWAWLGVVPFLMRDVRPVGAFSVPGLSNFTETNLRTYVHLDGEDPGVWFYSLEASNRIACAIARRWYGLPYFSAHIQTRLRGSSYQSASMRTGGRAITEITAEVGEVRAMAESGSLEYFLTERYLLYSMRAEKLVQGQVWHSPYLLHDVTSFAVEETLSGEAGITANPYVHALYSPGVKVFTYRPMEI